jgi:hypothetical protein
VNTTVHRTTKKTPEELFQFEQRMLLAFPMDPLTGELKRYIGYKEEFRKVSPTIVSSPTEATGTRCYTILLLVRCGYGFPKGHTLISIPSRTC